MKSQLLIVVVVLINVFCVDAQYKPNTYWPYVYEDFQAGNVYYNDMGKSSGIFNIHLVGNVLHYIKDEKVYELPGNNIIRVEIGEDSYVYSNKKLMQVLGAKDNAILLKLVSGDFNSLVSSKGAYGSRAETHSSHEITALELSHLNIGGLDNPSHGQLIQDKNEGRTIPLVNKYYFVINGEMVQASKKEMDSTIPADRKEYWNDFVKKNKIKWKNEESLKTVLNFF